MGILDQTDFRDLPIDVQAAAMAGLVASAAAQIDDTLTTLVASLGSSPATTELTRAALRERAVSIRRKPFAQKVELLQLLWPPRWTAIGPLRSELLQAAAHRNEWAHSYTDINIREMLEAKLDMAVADPTPYFRVTSTRTAKNKPVDLQELQELLTDLERVHDSMMPLYFLILRPEVPFDVEWHRTNHGVVRGGRLRGPFIPVG